MAKEMVRTSSEVLNAALKMPNGARFYRCALQVNPFAYVKRHRHQTTFTSEADYNTAIVEACHAQGIEVIGVTDHYRIAESQSLIDAARKAGIHVFPGFEAVTKERVHFLCLFDQDKPLKTIESYLGACGIHDHDVPSPTGTKDSEELLQAMKEWGGVCIAAHVASDGGLLSHKQLSGGARIRVWKNEELLLACSLPGPIDQAPDGVRPILQNKNAEYKRERRVAVVNAQDVSDPSGLAKDGASCFIKMSHVSTEGLRQAFLDPDSRIRLKGDPPLEGHAEFLALTWQGGFLDGSKLRFNDNLNVLVGGRGSGKSTIIESIRYALALEPLGEEARRAHSGIVQSVLKSGTKVSLLVRLHLPGERHYTIERTVPNPPVVKDENGDVLNVAPRDVLPGVEIFGQHEISELTRSREKLTLLLERFIERDASLGDRKSAVRRELEKSRGRILDTRREIAHVEERLAALPALEETLKQFQEAGLESKLKEKSLFVREERVFSLMRERLQPWRQMEDNLRANQPIDTAFLSDKALDGLPNAPVLKEAAQTFDALNGELARILAAMKSALDKADSDIAAIRVRWDGLKAKADENYENILRELQKTKIDGEEFIRLRRQIEELRPMKDKRDALTRDLDAQFAHRRKLLDEWDNLKRDDFQSFANAAKKVSKALRGTVRVEVANGGNREPLIRLLRDQVGGNLKAVEDRLVQRMDLSLTDFAARCRDGKEALVREYELPPGASERIAQIQPELSFKIEELELTATTKIELNIGKESAPEWKELEQLSTGQKATAVLLLLLLESKAPLVVDQPEDDLDNRFITDGVVPTMRHEKRRRQFLFSTHNANIPVLGDAELILGLTASGDGAQMDEKHMGSIDAEPVRVMVEEILEGGKVAFETRRRKYGF